MAQKLKLQPVNIKPFKKGEKVPLKKIWPPNWPMTIMALKV